MPLQRVDAFLATDELRTVASGARRLQALQKLYAAAAPPELARSSKVKTCKSGTLVIVADNAAVAAKLRQLAGSLLAAIRPSAADVAAIKVETNVTGAAHERRPPSRKEPLTSAAVQNFEALSKRVPAGPLKAAIRNLVKHHAPRKKAKRLA
jgi:hypothetical protein